MTQPSPWEQNARSRLKPPPEDLIVREARHDDNAALIRMELESPLLLGADELVFDRSPDFFARHRPQPEHRILVAELEDRLVGVIAGAVHEPLVGGAAHRLLYIHHCRINPSAQRIGVAGALSSELMRWGRDRGTVGPYWLIGPENAPSLAFGGRGGGRWPVDAVMVDFDVSSAAAPPAQRVPPARAADVAALVNATHAHDELFEPLTAASLVRRLSVDAQYTFAHLRCVEEHGRIVAVAGLWDEGACLESIRRDRATGAVRHRSRTAAALDWGCEPGREDALAALLRSLAAEARSLGRDALTLCEPGPGRLPDLGLPRAQWVLSVFTPAVTPPERAAIRGLFLDQMYL